MWTQRVRADERGFTLVELLIVIVIVGILAAVAIPQFLGQADKARGAAATSVLSDAQTAMDTYRTDHDTICGATLSDLDALEPTLAGTPSLSVETCPDGRLDVYILADFSADGQTSYALTDDVGIDSRTCAPAGLELCHGDGTW